MKPSPVRIRCVGQSSVEYLVGCLLVLALLAADAGTNSSVITFLIDSIRMAFMRFAIAISVP